MIFKQYTLNGKRRVSNGKRHVIQRKQTRENVCGLCLNANSCNLDCFGLLRCGYPHVRYAYLFFIFNLILNFLRGKVREVFTNGLDGKLLFGIRSPLKFLHNFLGCLSPYRSHVWTVSLRVPVRYHGNSSANAFLEEQVHVAVR